MGTSARSGRDDGGGALADGDRAIRRRIAIAGARTLVIDRTGVPPMVVYCPSIPPHGADGAGRASSWGQTRRTAMMAGLLRSRDVGKRHRIQYLVSNEWCV